MATIASQPKPQTQEHVITVEQRARELQQERLTSRQEIERLLAKHAAYVRECRK